MQGTAMEARAVLVLEVGARTIRAGFVGGGAFPAYQLQTNDAHVRRTRPFVSFSAPEDARGLWQDAVADRSTLDLLAEQGADLVLEEWEKYVSLDRRWQNVLVSGEMELESQLERCLRCLYQKLLLVSSQEHSVVLLDTPLMSKQFRTVLLKVLFFHLHVPDVTFVSAPLCTVISAGVMSGLVVDLGWDEFRLFPVFDLRLVERETTCSVRSGFHLHYTVLKFLLPYLDAVAKEDVFDLVEEFIAQAVYVAVDKSEEDPKKEYTFRHGKYTIRVPNEVRYKPVDISFFGEQEVDSVVFSDNDETLCDAILFLLLRLDIDLRRALSMQIIFTGGLSKVPGLKLKLFKVLYEKVHQEKYRNHNFLFSALDNLGPVVGCSFYCLSNGFRSSFSDQKDSLGLKVDRNKFLSQHYKLET